MDREKSDRRAVPQRSNKPGVAAGLFEARMASGSGLSPFGSSHFSF
jgi:hypothetical protein